MDEREIKLLKHLAQSIDRVYERPKKLYWRQFCLGMCYGLGASVGVALLVAGFGYIVHLLGGLPLVGEWINQLNINLPQNYR